jgi:hypothetical protein
MPNPRSVSSLETRQRLVKVFETSKSTIVTLKTKKTRMVEQTTKKMKKEFSMKKSTFAWLEQTLEHVSTAEKLDISPGIARNPRKYSIKRNLSTARNPSRTAEQGNSRKQFEDSIQKPEIPFSTNSRKGVFDLGPCRAWNRDL